ncbi:unnamed protein product [Didymodactylos carnosus]|uniref:Uncharacterized protein n=1 Tax=Didymodactylos carnosus TaxID=1234261 RepID=A0A8S2IML9_9BILA|nr:unnamed protein product [Didymodactylos carnosus]CAF3747069.1 unnamed protein product [Didymodactylos carnosus]
MDSVSGIKSSVKTIRLNSSFVINYSANAWITLGIQTGFNNTAPWSFSAYIGSTSRPDGTLNTPPIGTVLSLFQNRITNVTIPVIDVGHDVVKSKARASYRLFKGPGQTANVTTITTLTASAGPNVGLIVGSALGGLIGVAALWLACSRHAPYSLAYTQQPQPYTGGVPIYDTIGSTYIDDHYPQTYANEIQVVQPLQPSLSQNYRDEERRQRIRRSRDRQMDRDNAAYRLRKELNRR